MGFQQCRSVRSEVRNPVSRLDTAIPKSTRQSLNTAVEFRIAVLPLLINDCWFIGENGGGALEKNERSELTDKHRHGTVPLCVRPRGPRGVPESHLCETCRSFGESHYRTSKSKRG